MRFCLRLGARRDDAHHPKKTTAGSATSCIV